MALQSFFCMHGEHVTIATGDGEQESCMHRVLFGVEFPALSDALRVDREPPVVTISRPDDGGVRTVRFDDAVPPMPYPVQSVQFVFDVPVGCTLQLRVSCNAGSFKQRSANKDWWQTLGTFFQYCLHGTNLRAREGNKYWEAIVETEIRSTTVSMSTADHDDEVQNIMQILKDKVHAEFGGGTAGHRSAGHGRGLGNLKVVEYKMLEAPQPSVGQAMGSAGVLIQPHLVQTGPAGTDVQTVPSEGAVGIVTGGVEMDEPTLNKGTAKGKGKGASKDLTHRRRRWGSD